MDSIFDLHCTQTFISFLKCDCRVSWTFCGFIAKITRQERSADGWSSRQGRGRPRVTFMAFGGDIRYGRGRISLLPRSVDRGGQTRDDWIGSG